MLYFNVRVTNLLFMTDSISCAISEFSDTFVKSMNYHEILFKRQYILESVASIDPGFTFNLAHDNNNNVTGIIWMTAYIRDNY